MGTSWTSRLIKKGMTYTQEFFPEWKGNSLLKKEGDFLVDELWEAQTFNGMLHGEVVIPETVWNRYLGRLADPEGEFQHFSIRLLPNQWLDLQLGFQTWGEATFHSEIISLVHNKDESALVLRYRGHSLVGGNWKSRLASWLAHRLGIVRFARWVHRLDWGDSVHIVEEENDPTLFRIDFRKSLWKSSLADSICDGKSILELVTIESVIGEMGRARVQTGQRGTDVLEKWGIWIARSN